MMKQISGFVLLMMFVIGASSLLQDAAAFTSLKNPGFVVGTSPNPRRRRATKIFKAQVSDEQLNNNNNAGILPRPIKTMKKKEPKVIYPFKDASMLLMQSKQISNDSEEEGQHNNLSNIESSLRKIAMISYIVSLCIALPVTLTPIWLISQTNLIEKTKTEIWSHDIGQLCSRWLLHMIPFCQIGVVSDEDDHGNNDRQQQDSEKQQEPSIWVCNHTSMLDTFILLATDYYLRGPNKRPIKAIYWKGLEDNPVINLMFKLCGFIPVQMEANGSGNPNEYDKKSFISLLRQTKKAFQEGFDILVLPEGQLNPWPEEGLLEVFPGAYKLALLSQYPIRFVALHGFHNVWHPNETIGMKVTSRGGKARVYNTKFMASSSSSSSSNNNMNNDDNNVHGNYETFASSEEFVDTFRTVVGYFGAHGIDHPDIDNWMDGTAWEEEQEKMKNMVLLEGQEVEQESNRKNKMEVQTESEEEIMGGRGGVEKKILDEMEREGLLISGTMKDPRGFMDISLTIQQDNKNGLFPPPVGVHRCTPPLIRHEISPLYRDEVEEEIATFLERENCHVSRVDDQTTESKNIDGIAANGGPSTTTTTTTKNTTLIRP